MTRDVAILGATASGKTALAVALARRIPGMELASADAYACYRRLDIGTAKPTARERVGVSWHLLDIVEPGEDLSITRFAAEAERVRDEVHRRGNRLCFVGGSGLYLRSVLDELTPPPRFPSIASTLEVRADGPDGLSALYLELSEIDPVAASRMEPSNRRRIVRALEVCLGAGRRFSSFGPGLQEYPEIACTQIGLVLDRAELGERLAARLDDQLRAGFLDEVRGLVESGVEISRTAWQAIGYRELAEVLAGTSTLAAARREILRRSRNLARRQLAWLRRDPRIVWVDATRPDIVDHVAALVEAAEGEEDGIGA